MTKDFKTALAEYRVFIETNTTETPAGMRAFRRLLDVAPPDLLAEFHAEADRMGLIPKPSGYVDGEPVYSLESIAKQFDVPVDDVREALEEMEADRPGSIICVDRAGIARIH
jgi:hypothetical protein